MPETLAQFAFWTFIAQFALFAIPLLATIYFCLYGISAAVRTIFFESAEDIDKYLKEKKAKEKALDRARGNASAPTGSIEPELPTLRPLTCQACGARVPMNAERIICPFCRKHVPVPTEYRHISRVREEATGKLRKATRYWRRARLLTSPAMRWVARSLALWLFAALVILLSGDPDELLKRYVPFMFENVGLLGLAVCTLFFWILLLIIFSYSFSPRVRGVLPTLEFGEGLSMAEDAACVQCGAPIRYEANDLAAICGYCGVETWRAKLTWRLHNIANSARQKANFSLVDAQQELSEAIWDALFAPLFLIGAFALLPLLLIGIGQLFDQTTEVRAYILLMTAAVIAVMLAFANRNELRRTLFQRGRSRSAN
jgi:predicted RNA-binding Zn-ribbon protein involved in translation (DUF1610 family)